MDYTFKKPTLESYNILFKVQHKIEDPSVLQEYLQTNSMTGLHREYINSGILPHKDIPVPPEVDYNSSSEEDLLNLCIKYSSEVEYELFNQASRRLMEYNKSLSVRFDIYTAQIRMLILLQWPSELARKFTEIESLLELGVDWARKNKFKVYFGLYLILQRKFKESSNFLIDALSTFESEEIMGFSDLVKFSLFSGLISIPRENIKNLSESDINNHIITIPGALNLLLSLYNCTYTDIFKHIYVFSKELQHNPYLYDKLDYFIYRVKLRVYKQIFNSYNSITVYQISKILNISEGYIIRDIEVMIIKKDLLCKVNHSTMMVYKVIREAHDSIIYKAEDILHTVQKEISNE
ncbi:26S proteasome regulatory subunit N7 [Nematocida parisii]|uniref:Uncharacterized protein n=1 Tax=Nematocida parisii (strain ERTm3) TaxID=935791 RepID=I3EFW1_NEMP3|nr:hypothetical protein NEQG_01552 [Nematocida parisii ERTm3]KAI5131478.1 26S proteasome regulatory subunit N7 [Nematocida parisii]KAI5131718.1 26S proteasome regulatory subunit N7 [Nematocida parisii]KAI5144901.1 26S proteasome regulatory subunit N7 [Nematocida parisii]KAI5146334.1 26S proteasome regulatory subunit N7 [Nematocida parisii]